MSQWPSFPKQLWRSQHPYPPWEHFSSATWSLAWGMYNPGRVRSELGRGSTLSVYAWGGQSQLKVRPPFLPHDGIVSTYRLPDKEEMAAQGCGSGIFNFLPGDLIVVEVKFEGFRIHKTSRLQTRTEVLLFFSVSSCSPTKCLRIVINITWSILRDRQTRRS